MIKISEELFIDLNDVSRIEFHENGARIYFKNAPATTVTEGNEFSSGIHINPAIKHIEVEDAKAFKKWLDGKVLRSNFVYN
jgi:hypothetical protein